MTSSTNQTTLGATTIAVNTTKNEAMNSRKEYMIMPFGSSYYSPCKSCENLNPLWGLRLVEGLVTLRVEVSHVVLDDLGEVAEFLLRTTPSDELPRTVDGSSHDGQTN
jgi:hypothetical protein